MEQNQKNNLHILTGLRIFGALVISAVIFFSGVYIGYAHKPAADKINSVIHKDSSISEEVDFNVFWKAWTIMNNKFAGADKVSAQSRMYGAIKGMLESFNDPYTTFFPPSENTIFESEISGTFGGVGIEIGTKEGILTVIAPLKNTPADQAGIKSGDKIIAINGITTKDLNTDNAVDLIRGKIGTEVELTIYREGFSEPKIFKIIRSNINIPTVDVEMLEDEKVFIIHLYNFSAQSPELFRKALDQYIKSGYSNLLLDLRGNPGGYLDAAVTIGGWFIPEGKTIVKEVGKTPETVNIHTSKGPVIFPSKSKLIILVDKGSASAAEILAGALSEHNIGILAGEQTFGKGSVQEVIKLTHDTSMKVTVAKWYTPKGISISESGLSPSVKIPYTVSKDSKDIQLNKAIELFKK